MLRRLGKRVVLYLVELPALATGSGTSTMAVKARCILIDNATILLRAGLSDCGGIGGLVKAINPHRPSGGFCWVIITVRSRETLHFNVLAAFVYLGAVMVRHVTKVLNELIT